MRAHERLAAHVLLGVTAILPLPLAGCGGPPGPPTLSVSVGLKRLDFSWAAVLGAESYNVALDLGGTSGASRVTLAAGETHYSHEIAIHRVDWANAAAELEACNGHGCAASTLVSIAGWSTSAIGFLKAPTPRNYGVFGRSLAVSGDGRTLAVGALAEDFEAGGVYVFARSGGSWQQQAALVSRLSQRGSGFGASLALSADGATLAVGAPSEGGGGEALGAGSGAVYVFVRSGGVWTEQAFLKAPNADPYDSFGSSLAIDATGDTLAVGAPREDGSGIGVNSNPLRNDASAAGAVYVFARSDRGWAQQAYVKATNTGTYDEFGHAVGLARDGNALLVGAPFEDNDGAQWDWHHKNDNLEDAGAAYVFSRASGEWMPRGYLKAAICGLRDYFGSATVLSGDGLTLAVGAYAERQSSGAVSVFTLTDGAWWTHQAYLKASNLDSGDAFGYALAIAGDGTMLVVSAPWEDGGSVGIGGNLNDKSVSGSGAVYVFARRAGAWTQSVYVKAPNPGMYDVFGSALGLSDDGDVLLVGAPKEQSAAGGIGGDQSDNSLTDAGAAYLY